MLKSLKHKLRLASQLSILDWLILLEAWGSVLGFWLALRWMSFNALSESRFLLPSKKAAISTSLDFMQHLYRLVAWAAHLHIFSMACLEKSLTLHWMLQRRGINAQIKIGANKISEGISAHAWVEVNGQVVGEPEDVITNFKVLRSTFSPISKRS